MNKTGSSFMLSGFPTRHGIDLVMSGGSQFRQEPISLQAAAHSSTTAAACGDFITLESRLPTGSTSSLSLGAAIPLPGQKAVTPI